MNKNLIKLFDKLAAEPELLKEFNEQKDLESLYKFSLSIVDGYTMEEFEKILNEVVKACSNQSDVQEVLASDLERVSGGVRLLDYKKLKSLMLSGILTVGGVGILGTSSAHAYGDSNNSLSGKNNISNSSSTYNSSSSNYTTNKRNYSSSSSINNNNSFSNFNNSTNSKNNANSSYTSNKNSYNSVNNTSSSYTSNKNNYNNTNSSSSYTNNKNNYNSSNNAANSNVSNKNNYNSYNSSYSNVPTQAAVISYPTASSITYGQKLSDSRILGGSANVSGSFVWKNGDERPNAGSFQYKDVLFIPSDRSKYSTISLRIPVNVQKAPTKLESYPSVSSITYGQSLSECRVSNFVANTSGTIRWMYPTAKLSAGSHICPIIFTPYSSNYESRSFNLTVNVNKANPTLEKNTFTQAYKPYAVVGDIKLPDGWRWQNPSIRLDSTGRFEARAIYDETTNYNYRSETVFIDITKAEPQAPSFEAVYNPNATLRDIRLPAGWHWVNENEVPTNSKKYYKASFNAYEAGTSYYYSRDNIDVRVNVQKAVPQVFSWPHQYTDIVYGTDLRTVPLQGGSAEISGTFKFAATSEDLRAGERTAKVIFTPANDNYFSVEGSIPVRILKNMTPVDAPETPEVKRKDTSVVFDTSKFKSEVEFLKDGETAWQSSPEFKNLMPNTSYYFKMRYKENDSRCAGKESKPFCVFTKFSAPSAPDAPKVKSRSRSKIVFKNNKNLEYSIDGGVTWTSGNTIKGLTKNTEYTVLARTKENDDFMPSKPSEPIKVKTNRFPRPLAWIFG